MAVAITVRWRQEKARLTPTAPGFGTQDGTGERAASSRSPPYRTPLRRDPPPAGAGVGHSRAPAEESLSRQAVKIIVAPRDGQLTRRGPPCGSLQWVDAQHLRTASAGPLPARRPLASTPGLSVWMLKVAADICFQGLAWSTRPSAPVPKPRNMYSAAWLIAACCGLGRSTATVRPEQGAKASSPTAPASNL